MHKSAAWPLALVYAALICYASLYPFADWRDQGIAPWDFLLSPLPMYWTGFDVAINVVGYAPLGFLLALAWQRSGRSRPLLTAVLASSMLSLSMETLQSYLPMRVPSNLDLALNVLGAAMGASTSTGLERLGALDRWSRLRAAWFVTHARGALALLALWPVALMFPASVPLGLGQVLERLLDVAQEVLSETPFVTWLPPPEVVFQSLSPYSELACVAMGLWAPCLLGISIIRSTRRRLIFVLMVLVVAIAASGLSAALSYGPGNAWSWLSHTVLQGLLLGAGLAVASVALRPSLAVSLMALSLLGALVLLNLSSVSPYFAQTLQTWEQGRFIRFHGLVQWVGWCWPYAALIYAVIRLFGGRPKFRIGR